MQIGARINCAALINANESIIITLIKWTTLKLQLIGIIQRVFSQLALQCCQLNWINAKPARQTNKQTYNFSPVWLLISCKQIVVKADPESQLSQPGWANTWKNIVFLVMKIDFLIEFCEILWKVWMTNTEYQSIRIDRGTVPSLFMLNAANFCLLFEMKLALSIVDNVLVLLAFAILRIKI